MINRRNFLQACTAFGILPTFQISAGNIKFKVLPYGHDDDMVIHLWYYDNQIRDTVISIPGGGWADWDIKSPSDPVSFTALGINSAYIRSGFNFATLYYRTGDNGFAPVAENDATEGVKYLLDYIPEVKNVFVEGRSAGVNGVLNVFARIPESYRARIKGFSPAQYAAHYFPSMAQEVNSSLGIHLGSVTGKLSNVDIPYQISVSPATWFEETQEEISAPVLLLSRPLSQQSGYPINIPWSNWKQLTQNKLLHNHDPQNTYGFANQLNSLFGYQDSVNYGPKTVTIFNTTDSTEIINKRLEFYKFLRG